MTQRVGILGWPVAHSRSPLIHKYWLDSHGLDGEYLRLAVSPEEDFNTVVRGLAEQGWLGANVTVPHKEVALAISDEASPQAQRLGAANILQFKDGKVYADNSDGYGFIASLEEAISNLDWIHQPALILGAGGAARAIVGALVDRGMPHIYVTNRSRARAQMLAENFATPTTRIDVLDWAARQTQMAACGLVVNTTSLGMVGQPPLELALESFTGCVVDIVYAPLETALLTEARLRGLISVDGLGMLLHQAVPAFEAWFGVRPSVTRELRHKLIEDLGA